MGSKALATAQIPDYLIYENDTIAIFSNPLESYLKLNDIEDIPGLTGCGSTACWRGYVAFWEIKNDSLFLLKIQNCYDDCGYETQNADLKSLFNTAIDQPVFAYWVHEKLISPQGRQIKYVHMGYESIYEREIHFNIKKGKLIGIKEVENEFENNEQIEIFNYNLLMDSIFTYVKKGTDWSIMGGEEFCDDAYLIKIGRNGKVRSVVYEPIDDANFFQRFWWNMSNKECIHAIKKPIKNVNFKKMVPNEFFKPMTIRLEIDYDEDEGLTLWK